MTTATSITVRVPLTIRRRPGRKTVVTPARDGAEPVVRTGADPALLKALARAFRYQRMLDEERYASISEMAAGERIERGYLGTLLRLTLLAPNIVDAILGGHQPEGLGLLRLLTPVSLIWAEQRRALSAVGVTNGSCGARRPLRVGTAPSVAEPVPQATD
ncbi:hypothetical protein GCM10011504_50800 [Siccirubricoccus deserti]|uniref:hypothetical protein n=1 Tax=Siccirubricoccus deserti TaxID=2013562 RepID=UPI00199DDD3D|nr:hypothetical protein [Siccirubricoccus deserti]GGC66650.1 hypothetical protein GCM10011504_50800 [Siccirubricoccus deserti]